MPVRPPVPKSCNPPLFARRAEPVPQPRQDTAQERWPSASQRRLRVGWRLRQRTPPGVGNLDSRRQAGRCPETGGWREIRASACSAIRVAGVPFPPQRGRQSPARRGSLGPARSFVPMAFWPPLRRALLRAHSRRGHSSLSNGLSRWCSGASPGSRIAQTTREPGDSPAPGQSKGKRGNWDAEQCELQLDGNG